MVTNEEKQALISGMFSDAEITEFKTGKTYSTRSICDHECIFSFKIHKRTAKSVWVNVRGERVRRSITVYDNREQFRPFGTYSMCAVISADREAR